MAVSYGEVHGYPKSRWVRGEFFGTRKLRCAWADRADLLEELDGDTWPYADGPYADESDGGNSYAIAREAFIEPLPAQLTADGNMASYEYAIVTVKYSTVGPQLHSTNWIEENLDTTVITQRIDYRGLAWGDGTDLTSLEAPDLFHQVLQCRHGSGGSPYLCRVHQRRPSKRALVGAQLRYGKAPLRRGAFVPPFFLGGKLVVGCDVLLQVPSCRLELLLACFHEPVRIDRRLHAVPVGFILDIKGARRVR